MKEGCHQKLEPVSVYKCRANIALYNLINVVSEAFSHTEFLTNYFSY